MKVKKIEIEGFPQVWKNAAAGYVSIIYRNRTELYKFERSYSQKDAKMNDSEFNPYNEIDMEKGNGSKRVHGMKTVKVIDFTK